ncbi:hypothetical protein BKA63DRAFT_208325 [Paraphoma chrysanthemicola]|nr:hypothetical protein BKA63DRAFT_208325 [Paraphoma chrysanthemicola]
MTEVENPHQFDWAHDAYVALNDPNNHPEKWASMHNTTFSIPPSVLTQASVERYGQVTPPEELSPADQPRDARESSIPVEQLRNETLWPQQAQQSQLSHQSGQEPSSKRRRTSRQTTANHSSANDSSPPQEDANPQPPKRKRGRPKSQPQMVEAYTADGFPFQVSSARQSHLEKNRVAAHKCRQRKKEYINGLEGRAREFSSKNKALKENVAMLREEVLGLKNEVLRHAGCGFWAVDEYLARCAGDLLGMEAPMQTSGSQNPNHQNSSMTTEQLMGQRHNRTDSILSQPTDASSPDPDDEFGGLQLLRDFDDEDMDDLEGH